MTHIALHFAIAWVGTAAAGVPSPEAAMTGTCRDAVTVELTGFTPAGTIAMLQGTGSGGAILPGGPCVGDATGLAGLKLLTTFSADAAGEAALPLDFHESPCGAWLQALDVSSCALAPAAEVPGPDPAAPYDLATAEALIVGASGGDGVARVAGAGDANGDGFEDVLLGAPTALGDDGAAYLVHGPVSGTVDIALAAAELRGAGDPMRAGDDVAGPGDVDGDGFDDLMVSATANGCCGFSRGRTYLVAGPVSGVVGLASADAILDGESDYDFAGNIAGAGDVNADGLADLLIGAAREDTGGFNGGAAYIVHGPVSGHTDLGVAAGKVVGIDDAELGYDTAGAGDVNGDGFGDVIAGMPYYERPGGGDPGGAVVALGPVSGTVPMDSAGPVLRGETRGDLAGWDVGGAGDVNGDGLDDVLVGAWWRDGGYSYVVHGPVPTGRGGVRPLRSAEAILEGEDFNDQATALTHLGDLDDDGFDDLLVGAAGHGAGGAAYVVYGPVAGHFGLDGADVKLSGVSGDIAGGVVGAADTDGDDVPDLLVSASGNDTGGSGAGAAYVVLGSAL